MTAPGSVPLRSAATASAGVPSKSSPATQLVVAHPPTAAAATASALGTGIVHSKASLEGGLISKIMAPSRPPGGGTATKTHAAATAGTLAGDKKSGESLTTELALRRRYGPSFQPQFSDSGLLDSGLLKALKWQMNFEIEAACVGPATAIKDQCLACAVKLDVLEREMKGLPEADDEYFDPDLAKSILRALVLHGKKESLIVELKERIVNLLSLTKLQKRMLTNRRKAPKPSANATAAAAANSTTTPTAAASTALATLAASWKKPEDKLTKLKANLTEVNRQLEKMQMYLIAFHASRIQTLYTLNAASLPSLPPLQFEKELTLEQAYELLPPGGEVENTYHLHLLRLEIEQNYTIAKGKSRKLDATKEKSIRLHIADIVRLRRRYDLLKTEESMKPKETFDSGVTLLSKFLWQMIELQTKDTLVDTFVKLLSQLKQLGVSAIDDQLSTIRFSAAAKALDYFEFVESAHQIASLAEKHKAALDKLPKAPTTK